MAIPVKEIWQSKVIILNMLIAIVGVLLDNQGILQSLGIGAADQLAFVSGLNIFLRFLTKSKIILGLPFLNISRK